MGNTETKICESCKEIKPISEFYFRKESSKYRPACKKCKSVTTKQQIAARVNAPTKICKHCNIDKPISQFQKSGGGKWTQPYCKPCDAERKRVYFLENIESVKQKSKNYYLQNREIILEVDRKNRLEKRPETLRRIKASIEERKMSPEEKKKRKSECDRRYREKNKDILKVKKKEYYDKKGNEQAKKWQRKQMGNVEFRTKKRLRGRIYVALKRGVKSESTMQLLGCSIEQFKKYFESLFTEGMNWEVYLSGGIHIDHIVPCKNFDLTDPEQQKKCFHFSNLQPLWELDNLKKGTSLNYKKVA